MSENKNGFDYSYSAKQQEEIEAIRRKYLPAEPVEESAMERLRRLDASVTNKGMCASLICGILGCLVFGLGMSCALVWDMLVPAAILGVVGAIGIALAYPVYLRVTRKQRERVAPEILRLTEELKK